MRCAIQLWVLLLVMGLAWSQTPSQTPELQRVLIIFDGNGHLLGGVYPESSDSVGFRDPKLAEPAPGPGSRAIWLGQSGEELTRNAIADPRATHAPLQGSGIAQQPGIPHYVLRERGTYLLTGPADAYGVKVLLPALLVNGLLLAAEEYLFHLNP